MMMAERDAAVIKLKRPQHFYKCLSYSVSQKANYNMDPIKDSMPSHSARTMV